MKKHDIDKILKDWADRQTVCRDDMSDLAQHIMERVRNKPTPAQSRELSGRNRRPNPYAIGLATAAATAIAVAGIFLAWPSAKNGLRPNPSAINIREKETHEKQKLLAEMRNVFQSDLQWVSDSNSNVQINVVDSHSKHTHTEDEAPVLLKIMLLRQTDKRENPQVIWEGDLMARSQQVITVNPDPDIPKNKMTFWLYPLNDNGVLVDFDLRFEEPEHLHSSSANHVVTKHPSRVLSTGNGSGEYKMYLSAAQLKETDTLKQKPQDNGSNL
ncbi:MAG: hypothetical protein ACOCZS_02870 [Verrucomicrobiota bacterium]